MENTHMEEITCPENLKSNFLISFQKHIKSMEETFQISISLRGHKLMFDGSTVNTKKFKNYIKELFQLSDNNGNLSDNDFGISLNMAREGCSNQIKKELTW